MDGVIQKVDEQERVIVALAQLHLHRGGVDVCLPQFLGWLLIRDKLVNLGEFPLFHLDRVVPAERVIEVLENEEGGFLRFTPPANQVDFICE